MFECHLCESSFQSSGGRDKHVNAIHNEIRYKCKVCGKKFMQRNNLQNHMRLHTNERPYKCDKCENSYVAKKYLDRHLLIHLGEAGKAFECQLCHKKFMHRYDLKNHVNRHTGESRTHKCHICEKILNSGANLRTHLARHDDLRPFPCKICTYSAKTIEDLKRHDFLHKPQDKLFPCDQCDKKFTRKLYLYSHMKVVHCPLGSQKVNVCIFCEKGFRKKSKLNRHLPIHTKEKYYSCVLCDAEFADNGQRDLHIRRVHTAEKYFSCSFCNKEFLTGNELRLHQKTHLPPGNPEKCEICGKLFRSKGSLKGHLNRIHSSDEIKERHKCNKCDRGFYTKLELNSHLLSHVRGKHPCLFCGEIKRLIGSAVLEHMGKHTGEKPWICRVCGYETRSRKYYNLHKKIHM